MNVDVTVGMFEMVECLFDRRDKTATPTYTEVSKIYIITCPVFSDLLCCGLNFLGFLYPVFFLEKICIRRIAFYPMHCMKQRQHIIYPLPVSQDLSVGPCTLYSQMNLFSKTIYTILKP